MSICLISILIVVEVINSMVVKDVANSTIYRIQFPTMGKQQVLVQYVDDTFLTLLTEETSVRCPFLISSI